MNRPYKKYSTGVIILFNGSCRKSGSERCTGGCGVTLFGRGGRGSEELPLPRDEGLQKEDGLVIPHPGVHLPAEKDIDEREKNLLF